MNWITERDSNGAPVRLWWSPESSRKLSAREMARNQQDIINALPMRSMRDWAEKHGLSFSLDRSPAFGGENQ